MAMHVCHSCGLPSPTSHGTGNGFCSLSCSDVTSIINADTLNSLPAWMHTTIEFGLLQLLPKNAKHPRTWSTHVCWNNTHDFAMGLSSTHHHASGTSCTDLECSKNNGCLVRSWFSALSLNPRNVSTYPQSSDPSQQQITLRRCQGLTLRPFVGLSKYPYEVMKTMNK